jgi:hypothetical protein
MVWKTGGFLVAMAHRLIPQRRRFRAAVLTSRILRPLLRRSGAFTTRERLRTDRDRESALDLVLMMLDRHKTLFDPEFRLVGGEVLPRGDNPEPCLVVTMHTMLSVFVLRHTMDAGVRATHISADRIRIPGTRIEAQGLVPSPSLLITVRGLFAAGHTVIAMIDRAVPERRTRSVRFARGDFLVSTALLDLAVRHGVRVVFLMATMDGSDEVTMTLQESKPREPRSVDGILDEFREFVDHHLPASETMGDKAALIYAPRPDAGNETFR